MRSKKALLLAAAVLWLSLELYFSSYFFSYGNMVARIIMALASGFLVNVKRHPYAFGFAIGAVFGLLGLMMALTIPLKRSNG